MEYIECLSYGEKLWEREHLSKIELTHMINEAEIYRKRRSNRTGASKN